MVTRKRVTTKVAAARLLGRLGGTANTSKQNAARKRNAQRAGRPRRVCIHCDEPVVGGHVDRRLDTSCGAHGWRWQRRDDPAPDPIDLVDMGRMTVALMTLIDALPAATRAELERDHPLVLASMRQRRSS